MRLRPILGLICLLACAAFAPARAFATPVAGIEAPAGDALAGRTIALRWSPLPSDVQEIEILLSLDGGRSYGLRVSPQLDPREGRYVWRVPNLPAANARLRLRIGTARDERLSAPSAPFRIVGTTGAPERQRFHEGGWWDHSDAETGAATGALDAAAGLVDRDGRGALVAAPQRDELPSGRVIAEAVTRATAPRPSRLPARPRTAAPRNYPQRN